MQTSVKLRRGEQAGLCVHLRGDEGRWEVLVGKVPVGEVWADEQRYNLNRMLVARGWRAKTVGGGRVYDGMAATRLEAVEAVIAAVS